MRQSMLILPLVFAAACSRGERPEPVDAGGDAPMGGTIGRNGQGSGMPPCKESLFSTEQADAGGDSQPVVFRPSEVLILLDGSESTGIAYGSGTRASVMADIIKSMVDSYQRRIAFGLMRFPDAASCRAGEGSDCCVGKPLVELGLEQGAAIGAALDNRSAPRGGSPLALALQTAASVFQARPTNGENRLVLLATDGQPGCGLPGDASVSSNACQDAVRAVQALANLDPPVQTLVLSPGSGDPEGKTDCLRALSEGAAEGMRARDASFKGFVALDDLDSLRDVLESTFAPAKTPKPSCSLNLKSAHVLSPNFAVYVDGQMIPENDHHGWRSLGQREIPGEALVYTLSLTGEYCTRLQQYRYDNVEVRYDCYIAQLENKRRSGYCRT